MASAEDYAAWIVANQSKKGTPDFDTVAKAYQAARGAGAAETAPAAVPQGREMLSFVREAHAAAAAPETTMAGLVGGAIRGLAPLGSAMAAGAAMGGLPTAGIGAVPGAIAGGAAYGASQLIGEPIIRAVNATFGTQISTPTEAWEALLTRAGVTEPKTAAERMVQAAASGLASGAGGVAAGQRLMTSAAPMAQAVGAMLSEAPASQVTSDIVGSSAAQAASELGLGAGSQLAAAVIGGGLGGKLPASGRAMPNALTVEQFARESKKAVEGPFSDRALGRLATEVQADPNTIKAADRLGITQYLQPDHVSTSQVVREIAQGVKSKPGSAARTAEMEGLQRIGERASQLVEQLGGTRDLSTLSEAVRTKLEGQTVGLKAISDSLYADITQALPTNTRVRADNTLDFIQQRIKEMNGVDNLTPIEKELLTKLTPQRILSKSGKSVKEIHPTYALIDELRKDVGEIAGGPGVVPDRSTRIAKQLRDVISQDQEIAAQAAGVADKWALAKDAVKVRKGFEDDMGALFGKEFDQSLVTKLMTSTTGLAKGDADRFANLVKAIPASMRESVVVSALGSAFGSTTKNGTLNFNTFSKFYENLNQNKQSAAAVFANLPPKAKSAFDDLAKVSKSINQAIQENIKTGRVGDVDAQLKAADSFMDAVYSFGAKAAVGIPIEAATSMVGARGFGLAAGLGAGINSALSKNRTTAAQAADAVLLSPEFRRLVVASAGNPTARQQAIARLASSPKFDVFAQAAGLPSVMNARELFIRNAILSGATSEPQKPQEQPTP